MTTTFYYLLNYKEAVQLKKIATVKLLRLCMKNAYHLNPNTIFFYINNYENLFDMKLLINYFFFIIK
jgi:hypothetical protein